jgi:hypothetical protein
MRRSLGISNPEVCYGEIHFTIPSLSDYIVDMKTITAWEFFREGIKACPQKVKTIDEIEAENARIFGKKPKSTMDSLKLLRELRG